MSDSNCCSEPVFYAAGEEDYTSGLVVEVFDDPLVLSHHTYQENNLLQCLNYRTISLISHPSKVMLKIILSRLKPQAKKIIAEEQAGFRAVRNLRILCGKYLQHQQDLYRVFIDFKKAFGRVWHAALWATMKKYNISANRIRVIRNHYGKGVNSAQQTSTYRKEHSNSDMTGLR